MEERLLFCSTEAAAAFPGYMEGAVIAADLLPREYSSQSSMKNIASF
jgi:hypothetical protein